jgi:hypothetical protein
MIVYLDDICTIVTATTAVNKAAVCSGYKQVPGIETRVTHNTTHTTTHNTQEVNMERQGGGSSSSQQHPPSSSSTSIASGSNQQWRNPTIQQQQKYNLRPLPPDFVPTKAEQQLLDMYEVLRSYERTAARIKEETAKAKLLARDAEFQQSQQQQQQQQLNLNVLSTTTTTTTTTSTHDANQRKTNKRQRKVKKNTKSAENYNNSDDDEDDDVDSDVMSDNNDDNDDDDDDDDQPTKYERREAKLAALREEIDEAKKSMTATAEDIALREQHLAIATETLDDGPMLKKRPRKDLSLVTTDRSTISGTTQQPSSLLTANMTGTVTPPHDFSSTLQLSQIRGKTIFPVRNVHDVFVWKPPTDVTNFISPNDGALELVLNDFDIQLAQNGTGNNTIAIKVRFKNVIFVSLNSEPLRKNCY